MRLGSAGFIRQAFLWALLPIVTLILTAPPVTDAQQPPAVTNNTSSGLNTTINRVGNSFDITNGTRPGGGPNLFHSFGDFSVGTGDIGNFQNTLVNGSFPGTSNILGRVTGGNISNIYGTIQTTGFEPDSPIRTLQ
jgi:filamentous hemagglutinin family protein